MCGIAGVVDTAGTARLDAAPALQVLRHRGPDAEGSFVTEWAAIAEARLRVIDLVSGDPPITNEDGSVVVALNGEIYNYGELRKELGDLGHRFRSQGDTEVIAHLAEELDPISLARRLDGMFAFAVWDERRRRLVLGRDRLGKKPLYYWHGGQRLVFGSEIKGVLADPAVPRRLDPGAIPAYLTFGYVPTPRTFYEGIVSVPPGTVLVMQNGRVLLQRYWEPPRPDRTTAGDPELGFDAAAREVRRLLADAVERRMTADVPVGAFLSGGVDSSAVVALMAAATDRPVPTFTIGFDDAEGFDERPHARKIAERFATDHTEFVVKPDFTDLVDRLVWHYDQPFGDSTALPTYLLSELTRGHVTVALSGDGGDELFAGYERFLAGLIVDRVARFSRDAGEVPDVELPAALVSWVSFVPEDWRAALVPDGSNWAVTAYESMWSEASGLTCLDRLLNVNLRTYLLDDLLPKVDRMSMAHGLEVRSPFLDSALFDFALGLPDEARVKARSLKRVLKAAVGDLLPPETLQRRKHGFGVPLARWFRTDLRAYLYSMLRGREGRVRRHLVPDAVDGLLAEHEAGQDHGHALWTLLTLEVFLRREGW